MKKSDYEILPKAQREKLRSGTKAQQLFVQINKLLICHADDVAFQHEGDLLDYLQRNGFIFRMLPSEFDLLVPLIIPKHKEQAKAILARNSKKRIIVSSELFYEFVSREKKGFSKEDIEKKIEEVHKNLEKAHMYEYGKGTKTRIGLLEDICLLYTSPSPRDLSTSRMPSSA